VFLAAGCNPDKPPRPAPPPEVLPPARPLPAPPEPSEAARVSLPPVEIRPLPAPPAPEKMPKVTILSPKANESIPVDRAQSFEVKLEVKDWPVVEGGPHVHLVLDNKPYKPIHEVKETVKLGEIAPASELQEGQHVLVAFPSDEAHVAVKPDKGKSGHAVVVFWVGKAGPGGIRASDPMLVFSRPKGTYNGEAAGSIVLDWYLLNTELADARSRVRATVTPPAGEPKTTTVTSWAPLSILNLPNGETRVRIELLDKDERAMPGPWNRTERSIIVNRDAK
jgi:hypothetical protein